MDCSGTWRLWAVELKAALAETVLAAFVAAARSACNVIDTAAAVYCTPRSFRSLFHEQAMCTLSPSRPMSDAEVDGTSTSWASVAKHGMLIQSFLCFCDLRGIVHIQMADSTHRSIVVHPDFAAIIWKRAFAQEECTAADPWSSILVRKLATQNRSLSSKLNSMLPAEGALRTLDLTNNSITLEFKVPRKSDRPDIIDCSLEIQDGHWMSAKHFLKSKEGDQWPLVFKMHINNLTGDTMYKFRAQAINCIGRGAFTRICAGRTSTPPSKPSRPVQTDRSATTASFSFYAYDPPGAPITQISVHGLTDGSFRCVPSSTSHLQVEAYGLRPAKEYHIKVSVLNAVGESVKSDTTVLMTSQTPSRPGRPQVISRTSSTIDPWL